MTTMFNGSIAGVGEVYPIIPQVPKNSTDSITAYGRLGDKITPKSLKMWGSICIATAAHKRIRVRMFVLTAKSIKCAVNKADVDIVHLLNDGQTDGGVQFDGTVQRRDFPVNTNKFTVLSDRSYDLFQSYGTSVTGAELEEGTTGAAPRYRSDSPNERSAVHFSLDIPTPATLQYAVASGNDPTNYFPFVVVGYTELDTNPASTSGTEIAVSCSSMLRFDDS